MLIIAFAVVIAAAITLAALSRAPEGYEDETGFHVGPVSAPPLHTPASVVVMTNPRAEKPQELPATASADEIGPLVVGERVC